MLILSLANISERYIKADQLYVSSSYFDNPGEMQGDERSNKALKSTYGSIQNNELHQTMQTGAVPSELTGEVKKLNNLYGTIYFILVFT
jgi:capsular polysaccharide biosynthesis protein